MSTVLSWLLTILLDVIAPILTYSLLTGGGVGEVPALVLSGLGPLLLLIVTVARERRLDEIGLIVLVFLASSVVVALLFDDPRLLLVKDSALTGLLGVVFLASLLTPRPLTFFFGRKFATGGNPDRIAWWNGLWQFPAFRRTQRVLAVVWGLAYLGEALLRIALSVVLPVPAMVAVNTVLPLVVTALLIAGTVLYGRRARAAAAHRTPVEPADTTTPAAPCRPTASQQ